MVLSSGLAGHAVLAESIYQQIQLQVPVLADFMIPVGLTCSANAASYLSHDLLRSHPVSLRSALVRPEAGPGKYVQARGAGRESPGATALHSCRRHEWQRLHLRNARERLSRRRIARRIVHLAAPGFVSRADAGESPIDQRERCRSAGGE